MTRITARVPDELAESLDAVAATLRRSRADVVRHALESYLEDFDDLSVALERLRDPADPVLGWDELSCLAAGLSAHPGAFPFAPHPNAGRIDRVDGRFFFRYSQPAFPYAEALAVHKREVLQPDKEARGDR